MILVQVYEMVVPVGEGGGVSGTKTVRSEGQVVSQNEQEQEWSTGNAQVKVVRPCGKEER